MVTVFVVIAVPVVTIVVSNLDTGEPLLVVLSKRDFAFIGVQGLVTYEPPGEVDVFAVLLVAAIDALLLVHLAHQVETV